MKKTKKLIILSLAVSIAISPVVVSAVKSITPEETITISAPIAEVTTLEDFDMLDVVAMSDYIEYKGQIVEVTDGEYSFSILVKDDLEDPYNGMVFHINKDVMLLSDVTKDFISKDELEIGMTISAYYPKDTIMMMSLPPQLSPQVIIVHDSEKQVIEQEIKVFDNIIINEKEVNLDNSIYKNKEDVVMIPLRQIAEALGYEVTWNNEAHRAELTKGPQWTAVTIGEDNYNFAKMLIRLGTAPEINNSKTYVPYSFLEEVLKVSVEITQEGIITIK